MPLQWRSLVFNPRCRKSPDGREFLIYSIKSSKAENINDEWGRSPEYHVEKRYSDFVEFHKCLVASTPSTVAVPALPPSRYFGRFDEKFIEERISGLADFLNNIHIHPVLAQSELVESFICREHTALIYRSYGGLERLELVKTNLPRLVQPTDILVKVHAASVNPADIKHLAGELKYLVRRDLPVGIGFDFSGEVVKIADGVTEFVVGDLVFGDVRGLRTGTVAEYVVVDESITCRKPSNLSHEQAAGAPLAGITALQCFSAGHMPQEGSVLITAGAGGVGSYAIQIARALYKASLIVTTASGGAKTDFVMSLGAHRVVNYRAESVVDVCTSHGLLFDCIIDCTGEASRLTSLVKSGGGLVSILVCPTGEMLNKWVDMSMGPGVSIAPSISGTVRTLGNGVNLFTGAASLSTTLQKRGGATYKNIITTPDKQSIETLRDLLESGEVVPQIDSQWDLVDAIEAVRRLESGRAAGKVIIKCS